MNKTYVIGEIGQNHNGSVAIAKQIIDVLAVPIVDWSGEQLPGVDAIKLQKRDLAEELTASEMEKPYESPNSFGSTYGEHRAALELSDEEHREIYTYAKDKGLDVIETLCSVGSLSLLDLFTPDRLKVASRDLTNLPLLEAMAKTKIPIILSTGMAGEAELATALEVITAYHQEVTILHCLSEYPARFENVNLATITHLRERYPEYVIGYSDHTEGIVAPVVAMALGAEVIEKHVTLSRGMKGSDHKGSLSPDGIFRMMRDLRHFEPAIGEKGLFVHPAAEVAQQKLERSVAAKRDLPVGHVIQEEDLHLLSPGTGLRWSERDQLVGQAIAQAIAKDELVLLEAVGEKHAVQQSA